jgi:antitoxin (DNA-binding transcriptional repressor) of toxin-antitoxin stability system
MIRITATEAARAFSDLVNRAVYRRESFEIERGGQVVVHVTPAPRTGDLRSLVHALEEQGHKPVVGFAEGARLARELGADEPKDPWQR